MPDATTIGKWFILFGLGLAVLGGLVWLAGRVGLSLGQLPGDINIQNGNFTFYFPLVTSVVISLILSLLIALIRR